MKINTISPKKALNKTYRKQAVNENELLSFKENVQAYIANIKSAEKLKQTEGSMGDIQLPFLKSCLPQHHIVSKSIKGQHEIDLAIWDGSKASDEIGVIIEQKRPGENDMISQKNANTKAMHEAVTYFLQERLHKQKPNPNVRQVIITDFYQWYIFDASEFFKAFNNAGLIKNFKNWRDGKTSDTSTNGVYTIIKNYIDKNELNLTATYVNLLEYDEDSKKSEADFIRLFKLFTDIHLLKKPFDNDANSLNKKFYDELLYLIGLEEVKVKNKKLIQRLAAEKRQDGSLLESAIDQLTALSVLHEIDDVNSYGLDEEEQLFSLGLELCITWINRILFLKLLEGQLLRYHQGHEQYAFLHPTKIKEYDDLQTLFFRVLAVKPEERNERFKQAYQHIPYLNSSLFERSPLERKSITIANLEDRLSLPLHKKSVLRISEPPTDALNYLLRFLNAYDFGLEGKENKLAGQNRPLINASVLGLIFEKINGYKEGSFYTPSFITMYMCRQTIRRAVCDKLGALYGLEFGDFAELRRYMDRNVRKTDDLVAAEKVIDGLTICDPAVGSGHFLVSALNELIATKAELGLLLDDEKQPLRIEVSVQNDELIVEDRHGEFFEYLPTIGEVPALMHNIQKTLFRQKQRLIENCLFGVDINPNSVKICRLRLWIELLKHTYYMDAGDDGTRDEDAFMHLKTLPNIDINIKCGNSLISRFALDSDLSEALKNTQYSIEDYQGMINEYHGVKDAQSKKEIERALVEIKETFKGEIDKRDPRLTKIKNKKAKLFKLGGLQQGGGLFDAMEGVSKGEKKKRQAEIKKLSKEIGDIEASIEADKNAVIYNNAFEWRYEFPKVLDDDGRFMGFDVVIGNPPYVRSRENFEQLETQYFNEKYNLQAYQPDLYKIFIEKAIKIGKTNSSISFIVPSVFLNNDYDFKIRNFLLKEVEINTIVNTYENVFKDVTVNTVVFQVKKTKPNQNKIVFKDCLNQEIKILKKTSQENFLRKNCIINSKWNNSKLQLIKKLEQNDVVKTFFEIKNGMKIRKELIFNSKHLNNLKPFLKGKHVAAYQLKSSNLFISYDKADETKFTNQAFRDESIFLQKKVLIRQVAGDKIFAALDDNHLYVDQTIYLVLKKDSILLECFLAYISSRLTKFYFDLCFSDGKDVFPKIKKSQIQEFPYKKGTINQEETIEKLVNQILNLKKVNPQADTQALEDEIDLNVYKLYNLTYEEVLIVDPDFGMSEGAYMDY